MTKIAALTEADLLPCPFCGEKASIERLGTNRQSAQVSCDECGAFVESSDIGICQQWNRRVSKEQRKITATPKKGTVPIAKIKAAVKKVIGERRTVP